MAEILKCPDCGSTNIFYDYTVKEYRCLTCGRKWSKEKPVEEETLEEEKEEETWLIRDETLVEVEGKVEEPLETPVEASEEAGELNKKDEKI